jgi:hypothetical protein
MREKLKKIALVLFAAMFFIAANGMFLEYMSQWYSTGGEVTIALHAGPSKDLPVPTLTERTYEPQTSPIVVLSVALLSHAIIYSTGRSVTYARVDDKLPSYTSDFSSSHSNRAPPAA